MKTNSIYPNLQEHRVWIPELNGRDTCRSFLDAQKRIPPLRSSCGNAGGADAWR